MYTNQVFVVGISATDIIQRDIYADVIREAIMAYDFVFDVMDWEEETTDIDRKKP